MNKGISITIIVILSILVIVLGITLGILIKKDFKFPSINNYSQELEENYTYDSIGDLKIKTNTADIIINQSEDDKITYKMYSEACNQCGHELTDTSLNVYLEEDFPFFTFFRKTGRIIVSLPKNYNNNIIIKTDTGDIKIDSLIKANANIKTDTGDTSIDAINKLTIDTDTGDAKINKVNDINIDTDTGDLTINEVNNAIKCEIDTGDLLINNASLKTNSKIETDTGDVRIKNINQIWIDADAKTGDFKINNNYRKSDIELIINTDTGDIKVG